MPLKTVIDTTDGLDEAVAQLYVQTENGFVLDIEGIDDHPEVKGLKGAYAATRQKVEVSKQTQSQLEAQIAELQKGKPDEAAILKLRQELEGERDKLKSDLESERAARLSITRDKSLNEALSSAGVNEPAFVKAATAMLGSMVKMEGDKPFVDSDLGPVDLVTYIKKWAASEGSVFVTKPQGMGAKSSTGGTSSNSPLAGIAGFADLPEK